MDDNLAALIDSATDAIVTADDQGQIASWNAAAERIFGYRGRGSGHRGPGQSAIEFS